MPARMQQSTLAKRESRESTFPICFSKESTRYSHLPYSPYDVTCPTCHAARQHRCVGRRSMRLPKPHIKRFLLAAEVYRRSMRRKLVHDLRVPSQAKLAGADI